jgi:hypothetical protein
MRKPFVRHRPQGRAEDHRDEALKTDAALPPDPIGGSTRADPTAAMNSRAASNGSGVSGACGRILGRVFRHFVIAL